MCANRSGFRQTLLLHATYASDTHLTVPVGWILMERETTEAYEEALQLFINAAFEETGIFPTNIKFVVLDFALAGINAAERVIKEHSPDAQIVGCDFHLMQNINKSVQKLGLKTLYQTDVTFRIVVNMLKALHWLPADEIRPAFWALYDILGPEARKGKMAVSIIYHHVLLHGNELI